MSYVEKLAELLNVELNEEFKVSTSDLIFKLTKEGLHYRYDYDDSAFAPGAYFVYDEILTERAKIILMPEKCPLCGNFAILERTGDNLYVRCIKCGHRGPACDTTAGAVWIWNSWATIIKGVQNEQKDSKDTKRAVRVGKAVNKELSECGDDCKITKSYYKGMAHAFAWCDEELKQVIKEEGEIMLEKKYYECEYCGSKYDTEDECKICETSHKKDVLISEMKYQSYKRDTALGFPIKLVLRDNAGNSAVYRKVFK